MLHPHRPFPLARAIAVQVALISLVVTVLGYQSYLEAWLLQMDASELPMNIPLMQFAVDRGRGSFEMRCAACHGVLGQGNPARGVPNLADDDWLYGTGRIVDIEKVVRNGIRSFSPRAWNLAVMPAFATVRPGAGDSRIVPLAPGEIRDVIEYLVLREGRPADPVSAGRGALIFADRGACYDCHAPDARGDSAVGAPNLVDGVTLYGTGDRQSLFLSIAYGRQGVCPAWIGKISAAGIREISAFVYSLSHASKSSHAGS